MVSPQLNGLNPGLTLIGICPPICPTKPGVTVRYEEAVRSYGDSYSLNMGNQRATATNSLW